MTLPTWTRAFTPTGWATILAGCAAVVIVIVLGWLILSASQRHRTEAEVGRVETALASSRTASAGDAIETTVRGAARDAATDDMTRENADAIHHAPGADQRLDPGLNSAGLRGLCRYRAYRSSAECVQLLGPVKP